MFLSKKQENYLKYLYWGKKRSTWKIAKLLGCSQGTIMNKMKKNNIPRRKHSECQSGCSREQAIKNIQGGMVMLGRCHTETTKKKISKAHILLWDNPEFREKSIKAIFKAAHIKPNKSELKLGSILQEILPNEYGLNVKAEIMTLGGKIPDFVNINGQKKLIELYGDYWHRNENPQDRIEYFKQFGWDTLVIWERELGDLVTINKKMLDFHNKSHCRNE